MQRPDRDTLILVLGFSTLSIVFAQPLLLYLALAIGMAALASSRAQAAILKVWAMIGHALGFVNQRILLSTIFFLVLLPVSMLYRLRAKDPLRLRKRDSSLYVLRHHTYTKEDLDNTW